MSRAHGQIGADGRSVLPHGIEDLAALGELATLDADTLAKLNQITESLEGDDLQAKFKLEVAFSESRSRDKPFAGVVCAWTNGGFLHGGGDQVVYLCPQRVELPGGGDRSCGAPLSLVHVGKRVAVCSACRRPSDPKNLVGQIVAKNTLQNWVTLIERVFHHLECNADLRMGHFDGDLRIATEEEKTHELHGEALNKVRNNRLWIAYPLRNIIKDTSSGATLSSRIRAFLYA